MPTKKEEEQGGCAAVVMLGIFACIFWFFLTGGFHHCPLSLKEFIAKDNSERFCAVEGYDGYRVDWVIEGLKPVSTGMYYESHIEGWEISVHEQGDCNCVHDLAANWHRVRGQIMSLSPGHISIHRATIELAAPEYQSSDGT